MQGTRGSLLLLATFSSVFAILLLGKPAWAAAVDASFILVGPFATNVLPCFGFWHTVIIYSYIIFFFFLFSFSFCFLFLCCRVPSNPDILANRLAQNALPRFGSTRLPL